MPRALITGISGQDGSYLSEQLLAAGYDVHGLIRDEQDESPVLENTPGVHLHVGDLGAGARVRSIIDEVEPDEVYNLAGISSVAYSWQNPVETGALSGLAVVALLEASLALAERRAKRVAFVQASSSEIFGNPSLSPQDETTPIRPLSPYGAAKAYAHSMTGIYRARGLHASSLVLYNHESPRRPERFVTRKITAGVARIARGEQRELVLGDRSVRRDWGWAPDFTRAMTLAARAPSGDDYVIGTGEAHSIDEFVAAAFAAAGIDDWHHMVRSDDEFVRPAEIADMRANAIKARSALGWAPSVDFEHIVAAMVEHDLRRLS